MYKIIPITGINSFDFFFSIFVWFSIILIPICAVLSLLVKRWFK